MTIELTSIASAHLSWQTLQQADFATQRLPVPRWGCDVWLVNLATLKPVISELCDNEQSRARAMVEPTRQHRFVASRWCLKKIIAAYGGYSMSEIALQSGSKGKPCWPQGGLEFNYSLAQDWALYGFSASHELGIDIEMQQRQINIAAMRKRKLSRIEADNFDAIEPAQQAQAMLACWTRKEAHGKCVGLGVNYTMAQCTLLDDLAAPQRSYGWSQPDGASHEFWGQQIALPIDALAYLVLNLSTAKDDTIVSGVRFNPIEPTTANATQQSNSPINSALLAESLGLQGYIIGA